MTLEPLYPLTPIQNQYYNDKHRFIVVTAGRRSRKTLIGRRKLLVHALRNPGFRYFYGAPAIHRARELFWDILVKETKGLRQSYSKIQMSVKLLNNSFIQCIGLEAPERVEGQTWNGCHITEVANIKASAWYENILPALSDTNGFAILDSVPESKNWYYDVAKYASGGYLPKPRKNKGAYGENPDDSEWAWYSWLSSDVLSEARIKSLKRTMSDRVFKQEFEGSFEDIGHRVYYEFDRQKHCIARTDLDNLEIGAGIDFNVDYMSAILFRFSTKQRIMHVFKEIRLSNSNTFELADALVDYLKALGSNHDIRIFPDPAGTSRQTSATESDHAILRRKSFKIRAHSAHPAVKDRVNAVNSLLMSADGDISLTIDPSCKYIIEDFERVTWRKNGDIDKSTEKLTHMSDGLGYAIEYLFPLKTKTTMRIISR